MMINHAVIQVTMMLLAVVVSSAKAQDRNITNAFGMEFVLVDTGSFIVGKFSPPYPTPDDTINSGQKKRIMWMGDGRTYNETEFALAEQFAKQDASDGFMVSITSTFYIGKYEVTQGQWRKIMKYNPSAFQGESFPDADSLPVESITWEEAQNFLEVLNKLDRQHHYRLPTEFEWEYAARGGAIDDIPWDSIRQQAQLGLKNPAPVGRKKPNAFGVYDMLGNVWEWVDDYYNEKIFADSIPPATGNTHVLKGASFSGDVKNATYMTHAGGPGNKWDVGFRIIMEISE